MNTHTNTSPTKSPPRRLPPALERAWWALVRFGFRLLYNEMAFTYDLVSWIVSLGQWRTWQRTAINHIDAPRGARILELAHGTGNMQIDLRTAGYNTVAMDLSPAMGRIARHKLHAWGYNPRLVRGMGQALPFPAGAFPVAISTFPTPFIAEPATLREIRRVLVPGGRLIIVMGGILTAHNPAADVLELAYRVTGQRGDCTDSLPGGIEQTLQAAGFNGHFVSKTLPRSTVYLLVLDA